MKSMAESAEQLASYLGRQLARVRKQRGLRQQEIEQRLNELGVSWTRNMVATFEIGRRMVTLEEALLLCAGYDVTLAQMVEAEPDTWVEVGPLRVTARTLGAMIAGGATPKIPRLKVAPKIAPTEAERRAASRLGVSVGRFVLASEELWGRRLEAERDRRVLRHSVGSDPATLRAVRGHVTRDLFAELEAALPRRGTRT